MSRTGSISSSIEQFLQAGMHHHQSGRLPEAEQCYRQILTQQPRHADALHLLGVLAHQVGRQEAAIELITAAVRVRPDFAPAYNNLANALAAAGRFDEAVRTYQQALSLRPDNAEAWSNLGGALRSLGRLSQAIEAGEKAVDLRPASAAIHTNLAETFAKVSRATLEIWTQILQRINRSRLLIRSPMGSHRQRLLARFDANGIASDRIEFIGTLPPGQYLRTFHRIDVSLDPMPYTGHTSSLDSLWMGVPVITFAGQTAAARGGVSVAMNLGMPEFVAHSSQEYVEIAAGFAQHLETLSQLRVSLRHRMQCSRLMNAPQFTRDLELGYRQMWDLWCQSGAE